MMEGAQTSLHDIILLDNWPDSQQQLKKKPHPNQLLARVDPTSQSTREASSSQTVNRPSVSLGICCSLQRFGGGEADPNLNLSSRLAQGGANYPLHTALPPCYCSIFVSFYDALLLLVYTYYFCLTFHLYELDFAWEGEKYLPPSASVSV